MAKTPTQASVKNVQPSNEKKSVANKKNVVSDPTKKTAHLVYKVSRAKDGSLSIDGTRSQKLVNQHPDVKITQPIGQGKIGKNETSVIRGLVLKHMKVI